MAKPKHARAASVAIDHPVTITHGAITMVPTGRPNEFRFLPDPHARQWSVPADLYALMLRQRGISYSAGWNARAHDGDLVPDPLKHPGAFEEALQPALTQGDADIARRAQEFLRASRAEPKGGNDSAGRKMMRALLCACWREFYPGMEPRAAARAMVAFGERLWNDAAMNEPKIPLQYDGTPLTYWYKIFWATRPAPTRDIAEPTGRQPTTRRKSDREEDPYWDLRPPPITAKVVEEALTGRFKGGAAY